MANNDESASVGSKHESESANSSLVHLHLEQVNDAIRPAFQKPATAACCNTRRGQQCELREVRTWLLLSTALLQLANDVALWHHMHGRFVGDRHKLRLQSTGNV